MPLGMMAPPMTEFTEDDLIPIPGWENISLDDALSGNYPGGPNYSKYSLDWDLSKLKTYEAEEFKGLLKLEKEGKLNKFFKGVLDDYKKKMKGYHKEIPIFKEQKYSLVVEKNLFASPLKPAEDYIVRIYDKSPIRIRETKLKNNILDSADVVKEIDKWSNRLKMNIKSVNLSKHYYSEGNQSTLGYVTTGKKDIHILNTPPRSRFTKKHQLGSLRHEAGHILDNFDSKGNYKRYHHSSSRKYLKAIRKDDINNNSAFPSKYSKDSFIETNAYYEDFAESVKLVVKGDNQFKNKFPNRYKYIKNILKL